MDCEFVRQLLPYSRPAELEAADLARLDDHLAACPECGSFAHADRSGDDVIARAMQAVPVPDGIRDRLATRLTAARRTWWRRTALTASAACVAALLAMSGLYSVTRPTLDLTAAATVANAQPGLWKPEGRALADANDLLRSLGAPPAAPEDFKYGLFVEALRTDSHGVRSAPRLLFFDNQFYAYAKVVLVREGQIKNLSGLVDLVGEDSGCFVTVRAVPGHRGWYYIITTYGKPLQHFLRPKERANPA